MTGGPAPRRRRSTSPAARQLRTYVEDQTCGPPSSAMPSAVKPYVAPELGAASPRRRRPWCPNRKFAPTTTARGVQRSTRTSSTNRSGVQPATSRVNGSTQHASTPAAASSSARRSSVVSIGGRVLGPEHRHRVRVEGDRHDRQRRARGRDLAGPADDVLVPEVHAVEVADRRRRVRPEVGGHLVERAPDLHGGLLLRSGRRRPGMLPRRLRRRRRRRAAPVAALARRARGTSPSGREAPPPGRPRPTAGASLRP